MKAIRFKLTPDENLPMFSRLIGEVVDVSFREVVEQGIHPWTGDDQHRDLADAFVERMNRDNHEPTGLRDHDIVRDFVLPPWNQWSSKTRFEQVVERIQKNILFCDTSLTFPALYKIARRELTKQWSSRLALELAETLKPSFPELRRFLKSKDRRVKLHGRMDLGDYDWSQVLSLDDFANHERLIIDVAVSTLNFRNKSFLAAVTDDYGRLRMVSSIDHITLTQPATNEHRVPILWQAERQGKHWQLRPNVGASRDAREDAQEFASRWRRDMGTLCFSVRTQDVVDMVDSESASASFPRLRYTLGQYSPTVVGQVAKAKVPLYVLGTIPNQSWSRERLKSILREYGVPITGVKMVLVERLAKLADSEYCAQRLILDCFFSENRFVRVSREVRYGEQFPVLGRENTLKSLLLHLYALRHLRGNVVIDPAYENDSCNVQDLALALISGRIRPTGGYLQLA